MDIDGDFDPAVYEERFNLTDCPGARVESRKAPAVRANRIKLFARGLGITGWRLKTMDRRPQYTVSAAELKWRDQFFADHKLQGAWVVGVQCLRRSLLIGQLDLQSRGGARSRPR